MSTATAQALLDLATAEELIASATSVLSTPDLPAGHALLFAQLLENLGATQTRAQPRAAHALRRSGAHKLDQPSLQAIADVADDLSIEALEAAKGHTTAGRTHYRSARALMHDLLNIPRSTVNDRLVQADCLIGSIDDSGTEQLPWLPQLAQQFTDVSVDPRVVLGATMKLHSARKDFADSADGEQQRHQLESQTVQMIRGEPKSARKHIGDLIAQLKAGKRPLKALLDEVGLFRRGVRKGLIEYHLRVLPSQGEVIESYFAALANPSTLAGNRDALAETEAAFTGEHTADWDNESTKPDWASEETDPEHGVGEDPAPENPDTAEPPDPDPFDPDETPPAPPPAWEDLKPERRRLIGLMALLMADHSASTAGTTGTTGTNGTNKNRAGLATGQVSIILDYEKMLARAPSYAVTSSGFALSPGEVRAAMCSAGIYPVILNGDCLPLDLGRTQRLFSKAQGRALRAAYRGCSYPGCSMPAARCELDHLDAWEKGGCTDITSAALGCPVHHVERHCGLFHAVKIQGCRPMVLLPRSVDPEQKLRVNTYFMSPDEAIKADQHADRMTELWKAGKLDVEIVAP